MLFPSFGLLAAASSLFSLAAAHNIQMKAYMRECFHEQLHKDDKMTVTFQVGDREFGGSGNLEIDFWVRALHPMDLYISEQATNCRTHRSRHLPGATKSTSVACHRAITPLPLWKMENTHTASTTSIGARTLKRCHSMCTASSMFPSQRHPRTPLRRRVRENISYLKTHADIASTVTLGACHPSQGRAGLHRCAREDPQKHS